MQGVPKGLEGFQVVIPREHLGLECVVVKIVMSVMQIVVKIASFSMAGMFCSRECQFQQGWNVLWSTTSISAWLECVLVKITSFSKAGICCGQQRQFQHGWNVSWSKSAVSAITMCCGFKTSVSACL
jgi:hypothetical protein